MNPSRRKLLIYGLLAVAALAVSVEMAIRARLFFFDEHVYDEHGLFRYPPNTRVSADATYTTNNFGFLGDSLAVPKPAGAYRVFLMGSSVLVSPLIPEATQRELSAACPGVRFEVNSTGIPRWNSWHNRVLFEQYLLPLEPDCVVIYLGFNDNVYNTNPTLEGAPPSGLWDCRDFSTSVLLEMLWYHLVHKRLLVETEFTEIRSAAIFERNLRAIIDAARERDIAVALVKIGTSYPTDDPHLQKIITLAEPGMRHYWGNFDAAMRGMHAHRGVMDRLAAEYGLPLGDADAVLPKDAETFQDLAHLTNRGCHLLGRHFADVLIQGRVAMPRDGAAGGA